jgi:hypothetical protein
MPETRNAAHRVSSDVLFVLGAGVDRVLGLPLLNTLFKDLSEFARGVGKGINKAIRKHAKRVPFDLQTYSGDEAENLGQKLLGSHTHLLPKIVSALDKHPDSGSDNVSAIKSLMKKLSAIKNENELDESLVAKLARMAGEEASGVIDTLLDTNHIAFRPTIRQAIKTLFSQVSSEIPNLTREEQDAFAEVIAILSNFEELLGNLFTGYFTKHIPNQKKYFYLAWLFWAYIRYREDAGRANRERSFYKTLSEVGPGGGIITFNYTDFFYADARPRNGYFHGDSRSFIRFHTREYVANDVQMKEATTLDRMEAFIHDLHVDWTTDPPEVPVPALVPPLAVKPIICTEYLERWYECGQRIKGARTILIAGYSFSVADEHFNDLLRKGNPRAKLIVVDPKIDGVIDRVCHTLNHDKTRLRSTRIQGLECKADDRLMFVQAKAEDVSSDRLLTLLDDAPQVPPAPKKHP